jgi:NHLM bacteriocin system secretion protein
MTSTATPTIFRAEALDARGRIEALPSALHVTSGWTRGTLAGLALTFGLALAASAYVVVPIQISGNGVIADRSGHLQTSASAAASGYVAAILVKPGDRVTKGQPLARLSLPEQSITLRKFRDALEGLERDDKAMSALADIDRQSEASTQTARVNNIERQIASLEHRLAWLKERESAEAELLKRGISTETRAITARIAVQDAAALRDQQVFERSSLQTTKLEAESRREREQLARKLRINQAQLELASAQQTLGSLDLLASPIDGIVSELIAEPGAPVIPGQPLVILTAERSSGETALEAMVFVPIATGKQISPGDRVFLSPASLRENEHDRLLGSVREVSTSVSSRSVLTAMLGSDQLTDLTVKQGPVFKVIVDLQPNPSNPSGFTWTSKKGPSAQLTRGTPLAAKITVEHTRLLSLALPALRAVFFRQDSDWVGQVK